MPDLPILRTSERGTFKRCPWRWRQEFDYGYKPIDGDADAAWLGIGIHEAFAQWYGKGLRRGRHPAEYFEEWAGDEIAYVKSYQDETFDEGVWLDARELGIQMLENYVDHYGRDRQWHIIATERPFRITIKRAGKPVVIFQSRWDGVLRLLSDGQIYLAEHKSKGQIRLPWLEMDDQAGSYFAVASQILRAEGVLKPGQEIAGIIYNFLRRTPGDDRDQNEDGLYLNKNGEISKRQPPPPFVREIVLRSHAEQRKQLDRIADEVQWMNAVRDGTLPVIKTPREDCPFCPFWIPCQLDERSNYAEAESVLRSDYIQIDPYADDRKSA